VLSLHNKRDEVEIRDVAIFRPHEPTPPFLDSQKRKQFEDEIPWDILNVSVVHPVYVNITNNTDFPHVIEKNQRKSQDVTFLMNVHEVAVCV